MVLQNRIWAVTQQTCIWWNLAVRAALRWLSGSSPTRRHSITTSYQSGPRMTRSFYRSQSADHPHLRNAWVEESCSKPSNNSSTQAGSVLCCIQCPIQVMTFIRHWHVTYMLGRLKQCLCPSSPCHFSCPKKNEVGASISFKIKEQALTRAPTALSWRTEPKFSFVQPGFISALPCFAP